jgi:hypothetical protein
MRGQSEVTTCQQTTFGDYRSRGSKSGSLGPATLHVRTQIAKHQRGEKASDLPPTLPEETVAMQIHSIYLRFVLSLLILLSPCLAIAQGSKTPLTNGDVVDMIKAGLSENTMVLTIQNSPANYDTSPQGLVSLKNSGATERILEAILQVEKSASTVLQPGTGPNSNTGAKNPLAPQTPSSEVTLLDGTTRVDLKYSTPNVKATMGMKWINPLSAPRGLDSLRGAHADIYAVSKTVSFEVTIASNVNPSDTILLVKLQNKSSSREIEVGGGNLVTGLRTGFRDKDIVRTSTAEMKRSNGMTTYKVTPSSALLAGEYAIVVEGAFFDFGVDGK